MLLVVGIEIGRGIGVIERKSIYKGIALLNVVLRLRIRLLVQVHIPGGGVEGVGGVARLSRYRVGIAL